MSTFEAQFKRLPSRKAWFCLLFYWPLIQPQHSTAYNTSEVYEYMAGGLLRARQFAENGCAARLFMLPIHLTYSNKGIMQLLLA